MQRACWPPSRSGATASASPAGKPTPPPLAGVGAGRWCVIWLSRFDAPTVVGGGSRRAGALCFPAPREKRHDAQACREHGQRGRDGYKTWVTNLRTKTSYKEKLYPVFVFGNGHYQGENSG